MKVTLYARVSTEDKDQNPQRQFLACRNYCKLHNHEVLGEYTDHISGDTSPYSRFGFAKMMAHNPQGIIVFSIDRLSRQHPNKTMQLLSQFKDSGIMIISVSEAIFNMESVFAEPLQYLLSWWNNYYLTKLREDIKSGLDRARADGKIIGRPKCKFNEYRAYQLLFNEKKTLTEAHAELGTSRTTLHRFKKVVEKNPDLFKKKLKFQ